MNIFLRNYQNRTRLECKVTKSGRFKICRTIRIEPDWNVKRAEDNSLQVMQSIRIEPDWNVKSFVIEKLKIKSDQNRTRLECKVLRVAPLRSAHLNQNRTRLECKELLNDLKEAVFTYIRIEPDWNVKRLLRFHYQSKAVLEQNQIGM